MLEPSLKSLYIEMHSELACLASGTAFVVKYRNREILLTNRHNVTGRDNLTNEILGFTTPIELHVTFPLLKLSKSGDVQWQVVKMELYKDGERNWFEHPSLGSKADFVGLPISDLPEGIALLPYELVESDPISMSLRYSPSDRINVIGFPFGAKVGGSLAIWATGFIASEPIYDYGNLPVFLIDVRARKGQSGSPVVLYAPPFERLVDNKGNTVSFDQPITELLGIYSGRINTESDLGTVWKKSAILELIKSIN